MILGLRRPRQGKPATMASRGPVGNGLNPAGELRDCQPRVGDTTTTTTTTAKLPPPNPARCNGWPALFVNIGQGACGA